jgi:hypothetical protein
MKMLFCTGIILLTWGFVQASPQDKTNLPASQETETAKKAGGPEKTPRKPVVTILAGFDLLEPSKVEKLPMVVGATRGLVPHPHLVALAPRLGKLYGAHPVFAWSCDLQVPKSFFILTDDEQTEVFRAEADGTEYRYPDHAPGLLPGKTYFWRVQVQSAVFGTTASAPVGVLVVSPPQRDEIEKKLAQCPGDSYDAAQARARVFTNYRLWYDALASYKDLIARYPNRSELYQERGTIYAQINATMNLATDDFGRAENLQHGTKSSGN